MLDPKGMLTGEGGSDGEMSLFIERMCDVDSFKVGKEIEQRRGREEVNNHEWQGRHGILPSSTMYHKVGSNLESCCVRR